MSIKVIALDLDGTLLNSRKRITPHTVETLHRAMEKGSKIVLTSGRPLIGIQALAKELNLCEKGGYIIAYNGSMIIDCKNQNILYQKTVPMECIEQIYHVSKKYGTTVLTYDKNRIITENPKDFYVELECSINHTTAVYVPDFVKAVKTAVPKCLIAGENHQLLLTQKQLKMSCMEKLDLFFSEPYFLDAMPSHVDKASSLSILLKKLDCTRKELIAFGDGTNDISMIQYAGVGIAMGNACEELKKAADEITQTNDEDGVAEAVERYILK